MPEEGRSFANDPTAQIIARLLRDEAKRTLAELTALTTTRTESHMVGAGMQALKAGIRTGVLAGCLLKHTGMNPERDVEQLIKENPELEKILGEVLEALE